MTGVNFISGFLKYKIYSIYLGVIGLGIISQISSSVNFLTYLLPLGFPMGLTKIVAQNINLDKEAVARLIKSILTVLIFPVLLSSIIIFIYSSEISYLIFDDNSYKNYVQILSIFVPFIVLYTLIESLIKGLSDIPLYVKSMIISSLVSIIILVPLVLIFGTTGAVYGIFLNYIVFVIYNLYKLKGSSIFQIPFKDIKFDKQILKEILNIGIAFLIVGALYQGTILYLKRMTIQSYGIEGNGLFQSIFNISIFYFGFIFTSLSSYTFPKISRMKNDSDLTSEMNNTIRFIVLVMVPLILSLVIFRKYILLLLYTSDFLSAESFFKYQYLGDFFKAVSWVLGIWLIPRSKLFFFVLFDLILNFNLIFIYKLFINYTDFGITGVAVAYLISYFIHFVVNLILARKIISFRFTGQNFKLLWISIFTLVILTFISFSSAVAGYILIIPTALFWFLLNVKRNEIGESFIMLKNYIKTKT